MIAIEDKTIGAVWQEAVARSGSAPFLITPGSAPLSYSEIAAQVDRAEAVLRKAGYGPGHRAALCLGNEASHYVLRLAMNRLGLSVVPINPDYRPGELAYVLDDSAVVLAVIAPEHEALFRAAAGETSNSINISVLEGDLHVDPAPTAPMDIAITPQTEASLLYTSGTTGNPKGCILSHEYELMVGDSYARIGPPVALGPGDRIFNPLPAFHVNAGVLTFFAAMQVGAAMIQPARFSASSWWADVAETGATVFHYLGVVISVLMTNKTAGKEVLGDLRFGLGGGVEPALHVAFERRYGLPLIEIWGMTEMCRMLHMEAEPRLIETRAMGRARKGLEVQVWDETGAPLPPDTPGEMVLRHSEETPRKGFFSGYLNKKEATVEAWRGGWFHTGDTVEMSSDGVITFVDRKKNIIRRAGENIAAAEVENTLAEHEAVEAVAVVAVPDTTREEEVLACIVLAPGHAATEATARSIFDAAFAQMAYYKPPGWIRFVEALPVTGTQKVQKHRLFPEGEDPFAGAYDLRALKRRGQPG